MAIGWNICISSLLRTGLKANFPTFIGDLDEDDEGDAFEVLAEGEAVPLWAFGDASVTASAVAAPCLAA